MKKTILAIALTTLSSLSAAQTVIGENGAQNTATAAARAYLTKQGCLATEVVKVKNFVLTTAPNAVRMAGGEFLVRCTQYSAPPPPVTPPPVVTPTTSSISVSWTAPTTRTDGTALPITQIRSYSILLDERAPVVVTPPATSHNFISIPLGAHTVSIFATDTNGHSSARSDVANITL